MFSYYLKNCIACTFHVKRRGRSYFCPPSCMVCNAHFSWNNWMCLNQIFPPVRYFYYMGEIVQERLRNWMQNSSYDTYLEHRSRVSWLARPNQRYESVLGEWRGRWMFFLLCLTRTSVVEQRNLLHLEAHFAEIRPFLELSFSGLLLE